MQFRASKLAIVASALAMTICFALPATAATTSTIRVRLHPYLAAAGTLPPAALAKLEALVGTGLTLNGTTRTGALDLQLAVPQDSASMTAILRTLRNDRGVLWAETSRAVMTTAGAKALQSLPPGADKPGQRLMVRLKDGVTPDWSALLPQLGSRIGTDLAVERQIGNVWVLSVPTPQLPAQLAQMADLLQGDGSVQYADPVRQAFAFSAANDPYYPQQWGLNDPLSGVNAETAWALQPDSSSVVVAVVDTGILPHPDLVGRVLPGYDFISDPARARDGNARDPDPRDEGDWSTGECGFPEDSFFHGLFVAGLIAANTNNSTGIAGLTTGTRILPVRVLGACGGTFEDVLAGMLWASGVQLAGIPPNTNPAKVINLSLGGFGACDQAIQEAVDDALAQGAVVVAAAGNSASNVQDFTPASCSGVIAVAAHSVDATLASYSNYGPRIDVSAPGGEMPESGLIISTSNDGTTVPQNPDYESAQGTSFAAPMVAGTAAMMFARNPLLTAGRVLDIVQGSARDFPTSSICAQASLCGTGLLDAGAAIASTLPGGSTPPPGASEVVEYYNATFDHYFITAQPSEIRYMDTVLSGVFKRTGLYFYAYLTPLTAPAGARPVCRFFAAGLINSHFFSASAFECQFVLTHWPDIWYLETPASFFIQVPDSLGNCPDGTLPVYRFFNNRNDANHRYTVDLSVRRAMLNRAWVPEGTGDSAVAFCTPY
ncbi:MAG TPA: S8 family peptidase [Casimicrobiaceae bacterium]|nr:S8 family peptidase [Casimicrobiaceae bacterium]